MSSPGNYLEAPVIGPLSHQFPCAMPPHNSGNLIGLRPSPPLFYPSDNTSEYANARMEYFRTVPSTRLRIEEYKMLSKKNKIHNNNQSSLNTEFRKKMAIGKSSYKQGLPYDAPLTFRNYNKNDVKQALQKARSNGCIAPKKVGALENIYLRNPRICAWGSLKNQNL